MAKRPHETIALPHPAGSLYLSHPGRPGEAAVLYVHGFGSQRSGEKPRALESICEATGWTFAAFNFRGHGDSAGPLVEMRGSGLLADLEAVRDELGRRGVRRLFLVGSSMGGWAAAWFAVRFPDAVPACVLIAPAFDFLRSRWQRLTEAERQRWRDTGRLRVRSAWVDAEIGYGLVEEMDQFPPERLAAGLCQPLLIFHGMRDDVVPYEGSVAFARQAASPKVELRLYKDGDHRLVDYKDEMAFSAHNFFVRWLPWAAGGGAEEIPFMDPPGGGR
jgi:pimeloyl-ACP methyl ester carboxylesterase